MALGYGLMSSQTEQTDQCSEDTAREAGPYRLLAIHAHPDDESSKGAATMARYIDEGHRVKVVTCTGGERGDVLNPYLVDQFVGQPPEVLAAARREEMARAAAALGVEHEWLNYADSGLPEGDPLPPLPAGCFALSDSDEITQKLVSIVREFRPHVIITYDEFGGYPHPDHLKVHEVSMRTWQVAGDPDYHPELGPTWEPLKLYYSHGFIKQRFALLAQAMRERGDELSPTVEEYLRRWEHAPDIMPRVTTRVPVGPWFERRDDALRAHETQIDPLGPFFVGDPDLHRQYWPTEEFELARTRVEAPLPEDDLFAGL